MSNREVEAENVLGHVSSNPDLHSIMIEACAIAADFHHEEMDASESDDEAAEHREEVYRLERAERCLRVMLEECGSDAFGKILATAICPLASAYAEAE